MTFRNGADGTGSELEAGKRGAAARPGGRSQVLERAAQPTPDRILVIEDDPDEARLVERWLTDTGRFDVSVAKDGFAGRQLLRTDKWALVVSDLRLPGVDGCQLLRDLRTRDRLMPFVLMSGRAELSDARAAIRHGASDLLAKPLDRQTFVTRVLALAVSDVARRTGFEAPIVRLVDGLAHDVANSGTLVCGFADLLVAELARPFPRWAQSREYSDTIASAVQDMVVAIHKLQEITRWSPLQRKRMDLTHLMADTLRLIQPRLGDGGVRLRFEDRDAEIVVESDPVRLRYLIVALVLAVFEAGAGNDGDVTVAVRNEPAAASVTIRTTQANDLRLQLAVEALGPYVSGLDHGTDSSPSLALESRLAGHVICLTLPKADARPLRPRYRALVVDDDPMLATVVSAILRHQIGCVVDEANGIEEARVLLDAWRYQLVVTDLHLGSGSGLDLHRHLQQVAPEVARATVLMSGDPALVEIAGGLPTVAKPFTNEELADVCRRVLASHREEVDL